MIDYFHSISSWIKIKMAKNNEMLPNFQGKNFKLDAIMQICIITHFSLVPLLEQA